MKIERLWDSSKVWNYCVKFNRYTRGTNEEYTEMLEYVNKNRENPSDFDIMWVAINIVNHSNMEAYGQTKAENLKAVAFDLLNDTITYSVDEFDELQDFIDLFV